MNKFNIDHIDKVNQSLVELPVLEKMKNVYKLWNNYHNTIPKTQRYSLGNVIDRIFIEIIEMICSAGFSSKSEKIPYVKVAIRKLDTVKILLMVLWETDGLDENKYINLSIPLCEIGRNMGGWYGQLNREQNNQVKHS